MAGQRDNVSRAAKVAAPLLVFDERPVAERRYLIRTVLPYDAEQEGKLVTMTRVGHTVCGFVDADGVSHEREFVIWNDDPSWIIYLLSIFFVTFMSAGAVTAVLLTGFIAVALVVLRIGVARRGR
jgi:hypothetical protein